MTPDPRVSEVIARLRARQGQGPDRVHGLALPSVFEPRSLLQAPERYGVRASYERPLERLALVAIGEARSVEVRRREGPSASRGAARRALAVRAEVDAPALRPRLLGGFRFNPSPPPAAPWEPFGAGWLLLPRVLAVAEGDARGVVVAPGVEPESLNAPLTAMLDPASAPARPAEPAGLWERLGVDAVAWCRSVAAIADEVRAGAYEKAVLATSVELEGDRLIDVGRTLARLRDGYPDCHVFTLSAGGSTFLGASPELLVRLRDGRVEALGLAGSIRRGATPEEDESLGRELLGSAKDRIEHETVVRAIRERLAGATDELRAPNVPALRRLPNIQHLATEVTGRARSGVDVLELVRRLHPTPAVCGYPQDVARRVIETHEHFDRGWYAGPVGWVDARGEGEFAVALRSAVVRGPRAWLFAGNGIMGDSDPGLELAEVQLKFRPLAEALGGRPPRPRE